MKSRRRVDIRSQKRLFDDFFKIDEYVASYELFDKNDAKKIKKKDAAKKDPPFVNFAKPNEKPLEGMSEYVRRLNFERGDAVGVLLFNIDTRSVVLVDQFKLPTLIGRRRDDAATQDGWIVEVMAGMIPWGETPDEAAIRETLEETGYEIDDPKFICKFLSSPGGTSERIFLYFAKVTDSRRPGADDIGVGDENIRVLELSVNDLFRQLDKGEIDDPKLAIAAYWLKDNMSLVEDLTPGVVKYEVVGNPGHIIGYRTGSIEFVKDVHAWVNPENTDMMMDRFFGNSISARVRYLGANKDEDDGSVVEDTIQESLRGAIGERAHVKIGTVLVTESGMLRGTHEVKLIFHVAAVEGGVGEGITAEKNDLRKCVEKVLARIEQENDGYWRKFWKDNIDTVIFPMMGAGEGGIRPEVAANEIIPAAIDYFVSTTNTTLREIYFSAYKLRDKSACDEIFEKACKAGTLVRVAKTMRAAAPANPASAGRPRLERFVSAIRRGLARAGIK
jgi:nudix-type nucleoside diphosphatase (YffH/AdpP family)